MNVMTMPEPAARDQFATRGMMKAFVYRGPGKNALEERPRPDIAQRHQVARWVIIQAMS
jgi:hypothetical protein